MFEPGKVYKVKVETTPGEPGFGWATIVERSSGQMSIQLRTSKDANAFLPKGTRVWFVDDRPDNVFNGLWAASVIGEQAAGTKFTLVCSTPKLEQNCVQRRRSRRVAIDVPVKVSRNGQTFDDDVRSQDISRSGIALESTSPLSQPLEPGDNIDFIVESPVGDVSGIARVIRVDRNWFANKTIIGLEFTQLPPTSVTTLDELLVRLGGRPRHAQAETEHGTAGSSGKVRKRKGLSSWLSSETESRGKFVGSKSAQSDHDDDSDSDSVGAGDSAPDNLAEDDGEVQS